MILESAATYLLLRHTHSVVVAGPLEKEEMSRGEGTRTDMTISKPLARTIGKRGHVRITWPNWPSSPNSSITAQKLTYTNELIRRVGYPLEKLVVRHNTQLNTGSAAFSTTRGAAKPDPRTGCPTFLLSAGIPNSGNKTLPALRMLG